MTMTEPTALPAWLHLDTIGLTDDVRSELRDHRARVLNAARATQAVIQEAKSALFAAEDGFPEGLSEDLFWLLITSGELGALHDMLSTFGSFIVADSVRTPDAFTALTSEMDKGVQS